MQDRICPTEADDVPRLHEPHAEVWLLEEVLELLPIAAELEKDVAAYSVRGADVGVREPDPIFRWRALQHVRSSCGVDQRYGDRGDPRIAELRERDRNGVVGGEPRIVVERDHDVARRDFGSTVPLRDVTAGLVGPDQSHLWEGSRDHLRRPVGRAVVHHEHLGIPELGGRRFDGGAEVVAAVARDDHDRSAAGNVSGVAHGPIVVRGGRGSPRQTRLFRTS